MKINLYSLGRDVETMEEDEEEGAREIWEIRERWERLRMFDDLNGCVYKSGARLQRRGECKKYDREKEIDRGC